MKATRAMRKRAQRKWPMSSAVVDRDLAPVDKGKGCPSEWERARVARRVERKASGREPPREKGERKGHATVLPSVLPLRRVGTLSELLPVARGEGGPGNKGTGWSKRRGTCDNEQSGTGKLGV